MTGKVQLEDPNGIAERMSALAVSQAIPIPRRQLKPVYDVVASNANEEEEEEEEEEEAISASEGETEPEDGDDLDDEHFDDRGRKVDALGRCIDSEEDEDDDEDDDYDIKDPFINDEDEEGDEVPALLSCSEEDETCESGDETDNDDEAEDDSDEEAEEDD